MHKHVVPIFVPVLSALVACLVWNQRLAAEASTSPGDVSADVVVYGGTAGGTVAAVAAARQGNSVVLIEPQCRVGGMVSGGLDKTDIGDRATIGGLAAEFFARCLQHYVKTNGPDSQQVRDCFHGLFPEPKVAQHVFEEMLAETGRVKMFVSHRLRSTTVKNGTITSIIIENVSGEEPVVISGKVFIDTSYEGDLMAQAGVPYVVGRESRAEYGESLAGRNFMQSNLQDVSREWVESVSGQSDGKIQAYNIRGTITNNAQNRFPFPKPEHYDTTPFAGMKQGIIHRHLKGLVDLFGYLPDSEMPNGEFDPNVSDKPGNNHTYPDGSWAERNRIYERVRDNWLSMFYMFANDPDLPAEFRDDLSTHWGLPKDEFPESNHVTPQLYVREGRRMVGTYVLTQDDVRNNRFKPDGVCMGSYNIDCHFTEMLTTPRGTLEEGSIISGVDPWEIPYRSLVPPNVTNLIVGSAVSASHVAYSTLRMEPVYMMIGHACGLAADLAVKNSQAVQKVDTDRLRSELRDAHMPLDAPYRPVVAIDAPLSAEAGAPVKFHLRSVDVRRPLKKIWWNFDGSGRVQAEGEDASYTYQTAKRQQITALAEDESGKRTNLMFKTVLTTVRDGKSAPDDIDVTFNMAHPSGSWLRQWSGEPRDRRGYFAASTESDASVRFLVTLPVDGNYAVAMAVPFGSKMASNLTVKIKHSGGVSEMKVDERVVDPPFVFRPLGEFNFKAGVAGEVELSNAGANGQVSIDAFRWIYLGP